MEHEWQTNGLQGHERLRMSGILHLHTILSIKYELELSVSNDPTHP